MVANTYTELSKKDVGRALSLSPSNEKVIMYETGRATDLALKLRELGPQNVTVLVIK